MTERARIALVVDDNQINRGLAGHMLKRLGWDSAFASNGEEALAMLQSGDYDLVLLDLRMPRMSGEEVCHRIRKDLHLPDLPVVAYTAHGMPEERARILQIGFSGLLLKPMSFGDVRGICAEFEPA